jgi:glycosyltransferase involved in cell wall biosynthesis
LPRLLVLTPSELTRDPRARRQVVAARREGLDVVGMCGRVAGVDAAPLDGVSVVRVGGDEVSERLRRTGLGAGGSEAPRPLVRELRGLYRLVRLGALTRRLVSAGRRAGPFAIVHANDFDTLPAAWLLARQWEARLVYDAHEVYADQEPNPPRIFRGATAAAEGWLARRADTVVTVSPSLASELKSRLGLRRTPRSVLNAPELLTEEPPPAPADGPLRVIYQGAAGVGARPFHDVIAASSSAGEDVEITLRVVRVDLEELRRLVRDSGAAGRIQVVAPVPPDRLLEGLFGFHVGLIINRPATLTDELALPNKLFEYMMAGLAVVAPRLPGVAPLVEGEGIGVTFEPGRTDRLAAALATLAGDRARLGAMRARARQLALERYNAESQQDVLADVWKA